MSSNMQLDAVKASYYKGELDMIMQLGLMGPPKRVEPWKDILRQIILEIGDRPDLHETEYNKIVAGKLYARLPATRRLVEAIIKTQDDDFALMAIEKYYQLSGIEMPAPDTIPRQIRIAKSELKEEGKLNRSNNDDDGVSFDELMVQAEEKTSNVYPGLEPRFLSAIRKRWPTENWEENKILLILQGPFAGQIKTPDILNERLQLALEVDSIEFHLDRTSFTHDRQKMRALQYLGYYVLMFSGPELAIPGGIERALDEIQYFIDRNRPSKMP